MSPMKPKNKKTDQNISDGQAWALIIVGLILALVIHPAMGAFGGAGLWVLIERKLKL
jgi:hypothetical protein